MATESPRIVSLFERIWPGLGALPRDQQIAGIGDLLSFSYSLPLAGAGILWLAHSGSLPWMLPRPQIWLMMGLLYLALQRLRIFLMVEVRARRYGTFDGSLATLVTWAGLLTVGPAMLWFPALYHSAGFLRNMRRANSAINRWNALRGLTTNLAGDLLAPLIGLAALRALGGALPLPDLGLPQLGIAVAAVLVGAAADSLIHLPYMVYHLWAQRHWVGAAHSGPMVRFFITALVMQHISEPFGPLAAGLYSAHGLPAFGLAMAAVLLVALLARRASLAIESSRQHERILRHLERLGRAVLSSLPSLENLKAALAECVEGMFPPGRLAIWLLPDEILYREGEPWEPQLLPLLPWLLRHKEAASFTARTPLPWAENGRPHPPAILAPIIASESGETVGGIYLELFTLAQPWDRRSLAQLEPAVQSLAAQVASALQQIQNYQRSLELERISQELRLAGAIQSSLLPVEFPRLPGWQLAVTIEPAEETAGDFFDVIPLEGGKVGLVVADVMDKGIGPALYMAISRTLIRTYTLALGDRPEMVFYATNERILKDTRANLFVTAFFAILEPESGALRYANAGHLPPLLLRAGGQEPQVELLKPTGIPIGLTLETSWSMAQATLGPGDVLILYTDGIPEAQNAAEEFFGEEKLLEICRRHAGLSAEKLQAAILDAVHQFRGDHPPSDDITLMVLRRDRQS